MKKYIWEKKIKSIEWNLVTFSDWQKKIYTPKQLEYIITTQPKDLTEFRNIVIDNVVVDFIEVMKKHDIKKWDIQAILNTVVWTYNRQFNIAVGKAFWTYEEWISSEYFPENIRISDIERVSNQ